MFDGDGDWSYRARRALYVATQVRGGAGFTLVPHHKGVVRPELLRAVGAYDPDFVVRTALELEERTYWEDEYSAEDARRSTAFASPDPYSLTDRKAGDLIAEACTQYMRTIPSQPGGLGTVSYDKPNGPAVARMADASHSRCSQHCVTYTPTRFHPAETAGSSLAPGSDTWRRSSQVSWHEATRLDLRAPRRLRHFA